MYAGGIGGPGDPVTAAAGLQAYIGVHFPNLVQAPRGMVGHLQVPHHLQGDFSPASLMAEGVAGSGKKTREGGARGSRGGGGSRKRTRASPPEDAAAAGTPNSAEAGVPHLIIPPGRNVSRQRTSAAGKSSKPHEVVTARSLFFSLGFWTPSTCSFAEPPDDGFAALCLPVQIGPTGRRRDLVGNRLVKHPSVARRRVPRL